MGIIKPFRIKSFKKNETVIEFENVSLSYGNRIILDNINFKINEGQIFGMLGPNGVGKSTIFNLITGLLKPDYGKIIFGNKDAISQYSSISLNRRSTVITSLLKFVRPAFDQSLLRADISETWGFGGASGLNPISVRCPVIKLEGDPLLMVSQV